MNSSGSNSSKDNINCVFNSIQDKMKSDSIGKTLLYLNEGNFSEDVIVYQCNKNYQDNWKNICEILGSLNTTNDYQHYNNIKIYFYNADSATGDNILKINQNAVISSSSDINELNEDFLCRLENEKEELIYLIEHTSLEDGIVNEAVEFIRPLYNQNKNMTILWFHKLYSEYQVDSIIFSGILNMIYFLDVEQDKTNLMITLISSGLNSPFSIVQEMAIKVTEKWRSKECLSALKLARYHSKWIKSYAQQVIEELEQELEMES